MPFVGRFTRSEALRQTQSRACRHGNRRAPAQPHFDKASARIRSHGRHSSGPRGRTTRSDCSQRSRASCLCGGGREVFALRQLLFLLILLLTLKMVGALFDMGGRPFLVSCRAKETAGGRAKCHSQIQLMAPETLRSANRTLSAAASVPKGGSSKNSRARLY